MNIDQGNYLISDDARIKMNREEGYFKYVMELMVKVIRGGVCLDYKKCLYLKQTIEAEIKEKQNVETEFDLL